MPICKDKACCLLARAKTSKFLNGIFDQSVSAILPALNGKGSSLLKSLASQRIRRSREACLHCHWTGIAGPAGPASPVECMSPVPFAVKGCQSSAVTWPAWSTQLQVRNAITASLLVPGDTICALADEKKLKAAQEVSENLEVCTFLIKAHPEPKVIVMHSIADHR